MAQKNIHDFVSGKCKERGVKREQLHKLCNISRSTLYRYMRGISPITDDIKQQISHVLSLNEEEVRELQQFIEISSYDATLIQARDALDDFVFGKNRNHPGCGSAPIELILYADDRYWRTLQELLADIVDDRQAGSTIVQCDIQILNCMQGEILSQFNTFLQELLRREAILSVEHLLSFVKQDYLQITESFLNLLANIPLIACQKYQAYYNEIDSLNSQSGLLENIILLSATYENDEKTIKKHYLLNFLQDRVSNCICIEQDYFYEILRGNFEWLKTNYTHLSPDPIEEGLFESYIQHYANGEIIYLLKPNFCYDKIPLDQYKSLIKRCSEDFLLSFGSKDLGELNNDVSFIIQQFLDFFQTRIELSYQIPNIDIYSRKGLEEFVHTGRITDHLSELPPFNKQEIKEILIYVRNRAIDPMDSYQIYITPDPIMENDMVISLSKGNCLSIEYNINQQKRGFMRAVNFENKVLERIFLDYIEHHLIKNHVLPADKAIEVLNKLIASCDVGL